MRKIFDRMINNRAASVVLLLQIVVLICSLAEGIKKEFEED